jgi:hypothetical protein
MAITTVYQYRVPGQPGINMRGSQPRYGTRAAIEQIGQTPLLDTALEMDERLLDADGFTRPEYLTYRIHVKQSRAYAGWTAPDGTPAGAHLQVMRGDYDARLTERVFDAAAGAAGDATRCLRLSARTSGPAAICGCGWTATPNSRVFPTCPRRRH